MGQVYDSAIIRPIPDGLRENLYPVILPIERTRCLLEHHASGYNSQRDENPVIRDTVSSPYSVFEWISQFENSHETIPHNPSRRRESFRLKQNRGEVIRVIRCAHIARALWKGRFFLVNVERRFDCISPSEHCPPAGKNDFSAGQYFDSDLNANEMERSRPFLAVIKTFPQTLFSFSLFLF